MTTAFVTPGSIGDYGTEQKSNTILWGTIVKVDPIKHTMDVEIASGGLTQVAQNIKINSFFTDLGYGVQVLPLMNQSRALLYKISTTDWLHVGYFNPDMSQIIADKTYAKEETTALILQRYVDQGEVHLSSVSRNEIYLSNDGSVFLRAQYGASLKLDNMEHRLEGDFANLKFNMDGVRIRSGNVIRPVGTYLNADNEQVDTNEDEHVIVFQDEVIKESDLPTLEDEGDDIKEFFVQVGTNLDSETGVDSEFPSVGIIAMGDKIIDEKGEEIAAANKSLNFIVKNAMGGGIAIDEDGSFMILDQTGGSVTKFTTGSSGEKSFRIGNSFMSVDKNNGITLEHESGSSIILDAKGTVILTDNSGRTLSMDENGLSASFPGSTINLQAEKIVLNGAVTVGGVPIDSPFPAQLGATAIDLMIMSLITSLTTQFATHTHPYIPSLLPAPTAVPTLPPVVPLVLTPTPILPQVMSGVLQAAQFNIS